MDRRTFAKIGTLALAGLATKPGQALAQSSSAEPNLLDIAPQAKADRARAGAMHAQAMAKSMAAMPNRKLTIGMLVYPGMYLQDLVGPLSVLESLPNAEILLLWKNLSPVGSGKTEWQAKIPVMPTCRLTDCPQTLDLLFVPGGVPGTQVMMEDPEVLAFLADRGAKARWVSSVCTGSLILGAAGLLRGYRATSNWTTVDVLPILGAIPVRDRVVIDRNRITGADVTAGLDLALTLAAELTDRHTAEWIQLYLEYDPKPPFNAGSPATADKALVRDVAEMFQGLEDWATAAARRQSASWTG